MRPLRANYGKICRRPKKIKDVGQADFSKIAQRKQIKSIENVNCVFTGCPKSSFLYLISLYFSTIELVKQIIETKVVSFNLIH